LIGQHPDHAADQRLAHRHQHVRPIGGHAGGVLLGDDLALVDHQETVGVGVGEHPGDGPGAAVQAPDDLVLLESRTPGQRSVG